MKYKIMAMLLTAGIITAFLLIPTREAPEQPSIVETEFRPVCAFYLGDRVVTRAGSSEAFVRDKIPEICTQKQYFFEALALVLLPKTAATKTASPEPESTLNIEPQLEQTSPPPTPPAAQAPASVEPQMGDTRTVDGQKQIYISGFGWLENEGGGSIQTIVGSDGDINKQVGIMG